MRIATAIVLILLTLTPSRAHSLQGRFDYEISSTYGINTYGGKGTVIFNNRKDGTLIATAKSMSGNLAYTASFKPSGKAVIVYHDKYSGRTTWRGKWRMAGKKRAIVNVTTRDRQSARFDWVVRGKSLRGVITHRSRGSVIGKGTAILRPR